MPERTSVSLRHCPALCVLGWLPALGQAQSNYEIQVYGSDTVPANNLMVTGATDHFIVKCILGRRFDWGRHSPVD
jgi:hypothetical protein